RLGPRQEEGREPRRSGGCDGGGREDQAASAPPALRRRLALAHARPQEPVDPPEQEELALTLRAATHVTEDRWVVALVQQVGQPLPSFLVRHGASSPSSVASRLRPRRFQLFTEPSGTHRRRAIALSVMSP